MGMSFLRTNDLSEVKNGELFGFWGFGKNSEGLMMKTEKLK